MKTIYKYVLGLLTELWMPIGAKILTVRTQFDEPTIWAIVDTEQERTEKREFKIYGTGHALPDNPGTYLGTFFIAGGSLVFHVFEETKVEK